MNEALEGGQESDLSLKLLQIIADNFIKFALYYVMNYRIPTVEYPT